MWLTVVWLEQTEGPLAVAPGFIPIACTVFLGFYSLWIYTLLSLDVVGRALDLSQSKVPYPHRWWREEEMGGEEGVGIWIGIFFKSN